MKKTPLKRKKSMKRGKVPLSHKKRATRRLGANNAKLRRQPTITKLKKLLWAECKRIVRARHGYVCYTCGKPTEAPHTGHFITSATCSAELRYSLDNLRPQCYHCNINLSGNWVAYEAHLIVDHGRDFPDQLKKRNEETKGKQYDSIWYINKIEEYQKL